MPLVHWLTIYFRKVLTPLLWEMKKVVKILIVLFFPIQKKEFLLHFLYAFGFCNQAKSIASTLRILLVFPYEAAANQLQQSKGCCGVSHVLGFVQKSKLRTGIRAPDWLVTYLGVVHLKGELSLQNKSNWVLG